MRKEAASLVIALSTLTAAGCAGGGGAGTLPPSVAAPGVSTLTGMVGNGGVPGAANGPACTPSAFPYGVLALTAHGTLTVDRGSEVDTSIGLADASMTFSASNAILNAVYVASTGAAKKAPGTIANPQGLNAAASSARSLSAQLATLPATNPLTTLVREGTINAADLYHQSAPIDVYGAPGQNVLNLTDLNLQATTITLHGTPQGSSFVINVSGELRLYNTSLLVADGLTPDRVIVNVLGGSGASKNASLPKNGPESVTGLQPSQAQWVDIKSEDDRNGDTNEPRTTFAATLIAPNRQNVWIEGALVQGAVVVGTGTLHERALFTGCESAAAPVPTPSPTATPAGPAKGPKPT